MIESLRNSACSQLACFAVCTYGIGFFLTVIVRLFHSGAAANAAAGLARQALYSIELNAAAMVTRIRYFSIALWIISAAIWALTFIKESNGSNSGLALLFARTVYLLSFLSIIAAVSTAILFSIFVE